MERIEHKKYKYNVVSLFAGIGGFDIAFKNAGFNEYGEIVRDGSAPAISQDDDIPTFKPPGAMSEKDFTTTNS